MNIVKRNGEKEEIDSSKIKAAIKAAFKSVDYKVDEEVYDTIVKNIPLWDEITVEEIQDEVVETLRDFDYDVVADSYQRYRVQKDFIRERTKYMDSYSNSTLNAASSSETDANSNVGMKNVANLEGEVYKTTNRLTQRAFEKRELHNLFGPELASQYKQDIDNHIIYTHDEASSPVLKFYCGAYTLYPLMVDGVGNIDGITPSAPNDMLSFNGQVSNLVFLLSSQTKGAVALGDYFIALNYYVIQEFGEHWYDKVDEIITSSHCIKQQTILHAIRKGMKQFIYGVNQPAGNRSYNSPFTNVSFYDNNYFNSMFGDFYYPDGTKPEWEAIDKLQRIFMKLHRDLRLIKPLTFPVTTMALVNDGKDIIDKSYKELCAEEWAKGGSFFCYTSDNPTSLASCCRVLNEMSENTFSSTTGMTGIDKMVLIYLIA